MAVAIHERRAIRGVEAVAERPDGTHAHFRPHPTPMLDEEGNFLGAVNLLLDVTARKRAQFLRREAAKCLRLVNLMFDEQSREDLKSMAAAHEAMALGLERSN